MIQKGLTWRKLALTETVDEDTALERQLEGLFSDAVLPKPAVTPSYTRPLATATPEWARPSPPLRARDGRQVGRIPRAPKRLWRASPFWTAGALGVLLLCAALVFWFFDRRNPAQNGGVTPAVAAHRNGTDAEALPTWPASTASTPSTPANQILPEARRHTLSSPTPLPARPGTTAGRLARPAAQEPAPTAFTSEAVSTTIRVETATPASMLTPATRAVLPTHTATSTAPAVPSPTSVLSPTPAQAPATPARLVIPAINLEAPIITVDFQTLLVGGQPATTWKVPEFFAVGWHHTSAPPGQGGNTVLNGHQNTQGGVFRHLSALQEDDEIVVYVGEIAHHYRVAERHLVHEEGQPLDVRAQNARWIMPTEDERLTLVTCAPDSSSTHRLIVVAFPADPAASPVREAEN